LSLPQFDGAATLAVDPAPIIDAADIAFAEAGFDALTGEPVVTLRFNDEAAVRFARITGANIGRQAAIVLDGTVLSAPVIHEPITGGAAQISGNLAVADAEALALALRTGSLPVPPALTDIRPREACKPFDTTGPPRAS
jgi:preprotein translocase subunit SecD